MVVEYCHTFLNILNCSKISLLKVQFVFVGQKLIAGDQVGAWKCCNTVLSQIFVQRQLVEPDSIAVLKNSQNYDQERNSENLFFSNVR